MKKDINQLQLPKPIIKKVAVGHKMRQQLSDMSDKLYENTFIPNVLENLMNAAAEKQAKDIDEAIWDAIRPKIEFTITKVYEGHYIIKVKNIERHSEKELKYFIDEMKLNLREQYGTT
jgi:hypothetical protein